MPPGESHRGTHASVQQCAISRHAACGMRRAACGLQLICNAAAATKATFLFIYSRILLSSVAKSDTVQKTVNATCYLELPVRWMSEAAEEDLLEFLINVAVSQSDLLVSSHIWI